MGKIIGIDFGSKRIGIARADEVLKIAVPVETIEAKHSLKESAAALLEKFDGRDVVRFVIGLPIHMSGEESDMSKIVRQFAQHIESISNKPVEFIDERLTSSQIEKEFRSLSLSRKERAKASDASSASLILQQYLDRM